MIKKRKKNFFKKIKKVLKKISLKKVFFLIFFLISFAIIYFVLKTTIISSKNRIKNIYFSKESINYYYNPKLSKIFQKNLSGKNIFYVKLLYKKKLLKQIKKNFPIIKQLDINWDKNTQSAIINITYNQPNLIFFDGLRYLGIYHGKWIEINKKSKFLSGNIIILPKYIQNIKYLSGFFYKIDENTLKTQFNIIFSHFKHNIKEIKYFPGGSITIVILSGSKTKIIFNNLANIKTQIIKYTMVKKYLTGLNKIKYIDIGSNFKKIFIK